MSIKQGTQTGARKYRLYWIALLVCAGLSACGGGAGQQSAVSTVQTAPNAFAESVPFTPVPDKDSFYHQPAQVPDKAPGSLLQAREITFRPSSIPMPNKAWQIQFVTRDVNGKPITATAAVVKPLNPPQNGKSPLVAYAFAYNSLGAECVPSKFVAKGSTTYQEWPLLLPGLQTLGWTMLFTDHEGPFQSYAAGRLGGQVTLDAIRAALQFEPLGLSKETPIGMWGYSGGAIASGWAATLHSQYAPELNVKAVALGGTPADTDKVVRFVDSNLVANAAAFSLIFSAIQGVNRSYPQMITSILNEKGRAAFNAQKDGCAGATTDGSAAPAGRLADYVTVADPMETPGMKEVAVLNRLPQAGLSPKASTYVYHEILDEVIPIAVADTMVEKWCADGTRVTYQRSLTAEHVFGSHTGGGPALAWLESTLKGQPGLALPTAVSCNQ